MVLDVLIPLAAGAAMLTAVGWFVYKGLFEEKVEP